jgi:hypothetical protein
MSKQNSDGSITEKTKVSLPVALWILIIYFFITQTYNVANNFFDFKYRLSQEEIRSSQFAKMDSLLMVIKLDKEVYAKDKQADTSLNRQLLEALQNLKKPRQ